MHIRVDLQDSEMEEVITRLARRILEAARDSGVWAAVSLQDAPADWGVWREPPALK